MQCAFCALHFQLSRGNDNSFSSILTEWLTFLPLWLFFANGLLVELSAGSSISIYFIPFSFFVRLPFGMFNFNYSVVVIPFSCNRISTYRMEIVCVPAHRTEGKFIMESRLTVRNA